MPPAKPPPPPGLIELYRAAASAYRAVRQTGKLDYPAVCAGRDAVKKIKPELSDEEVMTIVSRATAYAAAHHADWFWTR